MTSRRKIKIGLKLPVSQTVGLSVLAIGAILQAYNLYKQPSVIIHRHFSELLPAIVVGWKVSDEGIGKSESQILNYDDAILRRYQRGTTKVNVYLSHWNQESAKRGEYQAHSPDICFPMAGWKSLFSEYEKELRGDGWVAVPTQFRIFAAADSTVQMVFWHLRNGRLSGDMMGLGGRWTVRFPLKARRLIDAISSGSDSDEVFIRITTSGEIEELIRTELWTQLIPPLAELGVIIEHPNKKK